MGAFVAAGARQKIGNQDGRDQPAENTDFERARHAAKDDLDRETRQRGKAAEQARRHEGAVAGRGQRIMRRGGMHQSVDIVPHRCEEAHGPCLTSCRNQRAPFS